MEPGLSSIGAITVPTATVWPTPMKILTRGGRVAAITAVLIEFLFGSYKTSDISQLYCVELVKNSKGGSLVWTSPDFLYEELEVISR